MSGASTRSGPAIAESRASLAMAQAVGQPWPIFRKSQLTILSGTMRSQAWRPSCRRSRRLYLSPKSARASTSSSLGSPHGAPRPPTWAVPEISTPRNSPKPCPVSTRTLTRGSLLDVRPALALDDGGEPERLAVPGEPQRTEMRAHRCSSPTPPGTSARCDRNSSRSSGDMAIVDVPSVCLCSFTGASVRPCGLSVGMSSDRRDRQSTIVMAAFGQALTAASTFARSSSGGSSWST